MSNNKIGKLVIAYSGGLDTSYCAVSLSKEYDVHAVSVNTGGFTPEEIKNIESNASVSYTHLTLPTICSV